MNSTERIRSVVHFQRTDRPALVPEIIAVAATMAGETVRDYVTSGQLIAQCQINARDTIGSDALFAISDLCVEAEALGCDLAYPEMNYPYVVKTLIKKPEDLRKIKIPDPDRDGRMPELLRAVRLLKDETKGATPVIANAIGPITLASRIMDIEQMLYMIVDEPEKFGEVMEFCLSVVTKFAVALVNAGADGIIMFDPTASPSVLPAKIFNRFEVEPIRSVFAAVKSARQDIFTWYSVAGPVQTNLDILTAVGADITTVDYLVPIETAIQHSVYTVINGNIKPNLFLEGSECEILEESKALLAAARNTERFILGSGCEIPLNSNPENIIAMRKAVEEEMETFEYINRCEGHGNEVTILPHRKKVYVQAGTTVLDAAKTAGITITTYCNLTGSCGECVVCVDNYEMDDPDKIEEIQLRNRGGYPGERLACQARVSDGMEVYVPHSSRMYPAGQCDISAALYHRSINDKISRFGFSPGILSKPLELSEMPPPNSLKKWLLEKVEGYQTGTAALDKLLSLSQESGERVFMVMDTSKKEIIDFSRSDKIYGVAIDIGATTISAYIHDLQTGDLKHAASIQNPKVTEDFGELARDSKQLALLQKRFFDGINNLILWFHNNHSMVSDQVYSLVITTDRLTAPALGIHRNSAPGSVWSTTTAQSMPRGVRLAASSSCRINTPHRNSSFPGGSAMAGVIGSGLFDGEMIDVFVNVGDRGEVFVGNRERILYVPTIGGTVFESLRISKDSVFQGGLIQNIAISPDGSLTIETLGGTAPFGMCGSSIVSVLAQLYSNGIIDRQGSFIYSKNQLQLSNGVFTLAPKQKTAMYRPITVTSADIEQALRAKAAYRAAVSVLMDKLGAKPKDIGSICVSGGFGILIDMDAARRIDMIPDYDTAKYSFVRAASSVGGRMALLSSAARDEMDRVAAILEKIDLARDNGYAQLLQKLQPIP